MHHTSHILFALAATSMCSKLPHRYLEKRDQMLNTGPGCISYTNPSALLPDQNSVTEQFSGGSPSLNQLDLTTCLNEYGCGNFANSWDGNVCGGRGWFKGPPNSKTSNTHCYQVLAPCTYSRPSVSFSETKFETKSEPWEISGRFLNYVQRLNFTPPISSTNISPQGCF